MNSNASNLLISPSKTKELLAIAGDDLLYTLEAERSDYLRYLVLRSLCSKRFFLAFYRAVGLNEALPVVEQAEPFNPYSCSKPLTLNGHLIFHSACLCVHSGYDSHNQPSLRVRLYGHAHPVGHREWSFYYTAQELGLEPTTFVAMLSSGLPLASLLHLDMQKHLCTIEDVDARLFLQD